MTHSEAPATPFVDWSAAAQVAGRLARPGPVATRGELDDLVGGLREAASLAVPHVLRLTKMVPAGAGAATARPTTQLASVYVVDRVRWARANTEIMAAMTDGVLDRLVAGSDAQGAVGPDAAPPRRATPASLASSLVGAAQVGSVLAALSSRVLGQFDPYSEASTTSPGGRLLLVAPNVLQLERDLDLVPRDFRLWVCLHEQTHALQFAAAPWLADHLRLRAQSLLGDLSETSRQLAESRLREKAATLGRAVVHAVRGEEGSLLDGVLTSEQKHALEETTAVMALLEGHADVMMDAVGLRTIRTKRAIRAKFERRRDGAGRTSFDGVLRRLLGMDAKLAQYRDGAAFVRGVEKEVGRDGFNAVWAEPANLPTADEIADAPAWVRRVHG